MMTYLCENCGSKFKSNANWIDEPCQNVDPNGLECGFPIAPILNLQIRGIEKEKFHPRDVGYVDCSGLSDSDIEQLKEAWNKNKYLTHGRNK